jgi:hypothetical protein
MPQKLNIKTLTLTVFAGAAFIFAVLWLLAWQSWVSAEKILPIFVPLSLIWVASSIAWFLLRRKGTGDKTSKKQTKVSR